MKKTLFLAFLSFAFISSTKAQKNAVNGYIIRLNGDTVKGFIDYKNWNKNPTRVHFSKELAGPRKTYDTLSIKGFGVNDKKYNDDYILQTLNLENSSQDLRTLSTNKNSVFVRRTVFLQKIVTGPISLFKYTDSTDRGHYIIMKNDVYEDLIYKKYYFTEASNQIAYDATYKRQLSKFMDGCSSLTPEKIEQTNFRENQLIEVIEHYNNCVAPSITTKTRETEKITVNFGALAGASFSSLNISYINHFSGSNFDPSIDITGGVSILAIMPRTAEKVAIYADLTYRKFDFSGENQQFISDNQYTTNRFIFNGNYLKINTLFRYTFAKSKIKPYINGGFSNSFSLSDIEKTTTESVFYSTKHTEDNPFFKEERKHEQGIVLGFGASHKKIGIELRLETTNGFSPMKRAKTNINTGYFLLHYQF